VIDELIAFQREIVKSGADVKPVERVNLHFTVKFLGELADEQVKEADQRLRRLQSTRVEATVAGVGAFPSESRPNVVWAGVSAGDAQGVTSVAMSAVRILDGIGERDDRVFQPHITLARVRSGRNRAALISLIQENATKVFGPIELMEIKLKSSTLTPKGPVYADVGVYALK
jgi:2'-5' RNA ligase